MENAPCYKCGARALGCHSDCAKYLMWVKQSREEKKKKKPVYTASTAGFRNKLVRDARKEMHDRSSGLRIYG